MNNTNNKNKNNCKQTRATNLNVKPGNMTFYVFKKNSQSFTKISLDSNSKLDTKMFTTKSIQPKANSSKNDKICIKIRYYSKITRFIYNYSKLTTKSIHI